MQGLLKKKKIILTTGIFILCIGIGIFSFAPQAGAVPQRVTRDTCQAQGGTITQDNGGTTVLCEIPQGATDPTQAAQNDPNVANREIKDTSSGDFGCFITNGRVGLNPSLCISNIVYIFTVGLGSALAYVGAYFFDITVSLALNSAAYALDFISKGWTVARDLANMGFILALVYIAYTIMLKAESSGTMQMLAWVIFVALIINFSFFFTRLVVDAGNILAVQFYNAIPTNATLADTLGSTPTGSIVTATANATGNNSLKTTKDLTYPIMQGLNMQGLFSNAQFSAQTKAWFTANTGFGGFLTVVITLSFLYIAVGAMYFILAVMFLTAGVKFLTRVVVLWFLIIASPLAFLAKTTTITSKYYDKWQHLLITHTFYPVVFLFIFLFIALFMNSLGGGGSIIGGLFGDLSRLSANDQIGGISYLAANIANVAIRLGFVIAMLYIGMKVADTVGVYGASAAKNFAGFIARRGVGAAGLAGRYTAGWAGQRYATSNVGRKFAREGGILGRNLWRGAGALGKASFDIRKVPGVKGGAGLLGINAGEAKGQGGYKAAFDARVSWREKEAAALKPTEANLAAAYKTALDKLSDADRQELLDSAKEYADLQEDRKEGGGTTQAQVTAAKVRYNAIAQSTGIVKEAKKIAGSDNNKAYAKSIAPTGWAPKDNWRNVWGVLSHPMMPLPYTSLADKEAAAKIRGAKNDSERVRNVLLSMGYEPTPPPPPPPPPPPGGGGVPLTRQSLDATRQKYGSLGKATEALQQEIGKKIESQPQTPRANPVAEPQTPKSTHEAANDESLERMAQQQEKIADRLNSIDTKLSARTPTPRSASYLGTEIPKVNISSEPRESTKVAEEIRKLRTTLKQGIKEGFKDVSKKFDTTQPQKNTPSTENKKEDTEEEKDDTVK